MKIDSVNENSILISFGDEISDHLAGCVYAAVKLIRAELHTLIIDLIPSFSTVLVSFDLRQTDSLRFKSQLKRLLSEISTTDSNEPSQGKIVELPVYYGPEVALDMDDICQHSGKSAEQVIEIHSSGLYRVYAIGFTPGFAYLGNVDLRIAMPRKATPRLKIPAGSLAIADTQTAIYPSISPGGWQIIGRTPIKMIDWDSRTLALMEMGDQIRFNPISKDEFLTLGGSLDGL